MACIDGSLRAHGKNREPILADANIQLVMHVFHDEFTIYFYLKKSISNSLKKFLFLFSFPTFYFRFAF